MKKLLTIIFLFISFHGHSQTVGQFRYDTTVFLKVGGRNSVKIPSMLRVTDSTLYKPLVIGPDSIIKIGTFWPGGGGGGGTGVQFAQVPLVIKGSDTISRRFNVLDYMGPGYIMGTTDATAGIQAAINACDAAGGGEVFFPTGKYIIGGAINGTYNSQIYIPRKSVISTTRNCIILQGEGTNLSSYGGGLSLGQFVPAPTTGTIIYSTLSTFSTAGQAVIGTTDSSGYFNTTSLIVKNIGIQVKNNPSGSGPVVGGINWSKGANCLFADSYVVIDTTGFRSTYPANDVSAIETPDAQSGEQYTINNVLVGGFRTGYKISEHVLFNNSTAMTCFYGVQAKFGGHPNFATRMGIYWCAYNIYIQGASVTLANFNIASEYQQIGKWYDDVFTIKDSANNSTGHIFYTVTNTSFGLDNTLYTKSGASNLRGSAHDLGVLPGWYDAVNARWGMGTISPQNTLDLSANTPYLRLNTTAATGASAGIVFTRQNTAKWNINMNPGPSVDEFSVYDITNSKTILYAVGGLLNLGGDAQTTSTAALSIKPTTNNIVALTNIGLGGTTPNAWAAGNALQKGNNSLFFGNGTDIHFNSNAYYDGAWKYASTNATAGIIMNAGVVTVRTAASGTADAALTWIDRFNFNNNGTLQATAYGAGTLVTDASGNITATSDERLKKDIRPATYGLAEIMKLRPITYSWNIKSGNETKGTYLGFSAQNVKASIPYSTGVMPDGYLTLQDRAIMAAMVNAIQEQQKQIEELKKLILLLKK